jgi:hypothetical protein
MASCVQWYHGILVRTATNHFTHRLTFQLKHDDVLAARHGLLIRLTKARSEHVVVGLNTLDGEQDWLLGVQKKSER